MKTDDTAGVFDLLVAADPTDPAQIARELGACASANSIITRAAAGNGGISTTKSQARHTHTPAAVVPIRTRPRRAVITTFAAVAAALLLVGVIVAIAARDATEIEPADTTTTTARSTTTTLPPGRTSEDPAEPVVPGSGSDVQTPSDTGADPAAPGGGVQGAPDPGTAANPDPANPPADGTGLPAAAAPLAGRAPYPAAVSARSALPLCGVAHLYETEDLVGDERLPMECFYYWVEKNEAVEVILTGTPPGEMEGTQILRHVGDRNTITYRNFPDGEGGYTWSVQGCHRMTKNPTILRFMGPGAYCDAAATIS